jgi:hypothetical protein
MDPLSIISKNLPLAPRGQAYSEQLQAIGGAPAYSWSVVSGALPTGVSLSSSGLLTAVPGAIPESAMGVHSFDVQVTDSVPNSAIVSVSMEVVPYGFDRVIEFLLDTRLKDLVGNLLLDGVTREKMEKHFFRPPLGSPEDTLVHLDRDILSEDWPTPGTDKTLREVLNILATSVGEAVKTVNTVQPNLSTQDFDLDAGPGITITPITNGLQISGDDLQKIEKLTASGSLGSSGGTLELLTPTQPDLFMALIETETDVWYPVSDIPAFAGKKMGQSVAVNSGGVLAFAVGEVASNPKVHVLWEDGANIKLSRFDGVSLVHEETWSAALASPISGEPLVMVSDLGKVIVAWCDVATALYYGVFNQSNYADTATPAYLNPPIVQPLAPAAPSPLITRLVGAVSPAGPLAGLCYIAFDIGGTPSVSEFDTATPGATSGFTGTTRTGPVGGAWIDVIVDSTIPALFLIGNDGVGGPADNLLLFTAALGPFVGGVLASSVLDGPVADGAFFKDGMILIDDSPSGSPVRAVTIPYIYDAGSALPGFADLKVAWQDAVETWPPVPSPVLKVVDRVQDTQEANSVFVREWDFAGDPKCDGYLVDYELSSTVDVIMRRLHFSPNVGVLEGETVLATLKSKPTWISAGHTSEATPNAWRPRIFTSNDIFSSVSETFNEKTLNLRYDVANGKLILANDSAFTWNATIVAAVLSGGSDFPPNLLIPCYQLAQALKDYFDDAGFYPSPSTSGGVMWSESQLASANTSGYTFSTYYSVVPGTYDMHSGSVAQAFFYSDEAAGLASDQTLVFRYNYLPAEILAAEAVIAADITANLPLTHPSAGGAANPNFYTLAELDVKLGSSYATTYSGPPFDYYRYFCFLDNTGANFHQGWFSQNYVDTHLAYGPHATTNPTLPVAEHFVMAADETSGVPTTFNLAHPVAQAHLFINGLRYWRDIDWEYGATMGQIKYLNRLGSPSDPGYTLHQYDRVSIDKYLL